MKHHYLAGLLTYSICKAFPFVKRTVAKVILQIVLKHYEITAAVTVSVSHRIPFSPLNTENVKKHQTDNKDRIKNTFAVNRSHFSAKDEDM